MVRVNLKGVNRVKKTVASGEIVYYNYHRATNTKLPDDQNSEEFIEAHYTAQNKIKSIGRNRGTLKSIIYEYQSSPSFQGLRERTRKDYLRQIAKIEEKFGKMPIALLNDARIRGNFLKWRDGLAKTSPKQADYAITVLGIILSWALDRGFISFNYAAKPRKTYKSKRASKIWTYNNVAAFLSVASSELQLALILARDTGQRQGDLLKLRWSSFDGVRINLTQSKTGTEVSIKTTDELRTLLKEKKAKGINATTILTRPDGQPGTCLPSVAGTDVAYSSYNFQLEMSGTGVFDVITFNAPSGDSFLALYEESFDPTAPCVNLLATNDDGGAGLLSSISLMLESGVNYILVMTTFDNNGNDFGDFMITLNNSNGNILEIVEDCFFKC